MMMWRSRDSKLSSKKKIKKKRKFSRKMRNNNLKLLGLATLWSFVNTPSMPASVALAPKTLGPLTPFQSYSSLMHKGRPSKKIFYIFWKFI